MALLFTTGAFECKFVMATVPCAVDTANVIVASNPAEIESVHEASDSDSENDDDYISATEDEAEQE